MAPILPDSKKRKNGYLLHLPVIEKAAVEEFARQNRIKPADVFHDALNWLSKTKYRATKPHNQELAPAEMTKVYLNLTEAERAIITKVTTQKKVTIVHLLRDVVRLYLSSIPS